MKYRFYSPVQGIIDYDFNKDMDYDSYFDEEAMEELGEVDFDFLTAEDLTAYQEEINQAIRKEWNYETDEDMGLMHYFAYGSRETQKDLLKKVSVLASISNIPEIMMQAELIDQILHTGYLDNAGIKEFEHIRENLRDLMKYISDTKKTIYDTNFDDEILSIEWKDSDLESDDLKNYKAKAEYYVRQHQDNEVIAKLKTNVPLTEDDVRVLENILWSELGTKQDYEAEYGQKPLGEFVREIVGLDMTAAKAAFSQYLEGSNLDSRQIYFVNQIIEYIVHNGMMKDLSVLQETPFTDQGSIVDIFTDLNVWIGIRKTIDQINANALAA